MFYFFFPNLVIKGTTQILVNIGSQLREIASYFHSICAEQEKQGMLAFVGLEKSTFLLITFKHKWSWYFKHLFSVQLVFHIYIFYTLMQMQLTYCFP